MSVDKYQNDSNLLSMWGKMKSLRGNKRNADYLVPVLEASVLDWGLYTV